MKFLHPTIRGARGPSTDTVLSVEDSQRTDSCTKVWLIPGMRGPKESPKDSDSEKLNLVCNRSESLVCEGSVRAQTDGLCMRNCTGCPSEEGQISSESGVWELKQIDYTRGNVQAVHLKWNKSVSLLCQSLNRWSVLEKL